MTLDWFSHSSTAPDCDQQTYRLRYICSNRLQLCTLVMSAQFCATLLLLWTPVSARILALVLQLYERNKLKLKLHACNVAKQSITFISGSADWRISYKITASSRLTLVKSPNLTAVRVQSGPLWQCSKKKTPTKLPECVVESPSIKKRPDEWSTNVDLGLPDFPQWNTGDFCPSIHPSPVRPMCRDIIPCMLPSRHKFHTSSEHC